MSTKLRGGTNGDTGLLEETKPSSRPPREDRPRQVRPMNVNSITAETDDDDNDLGKPVTIPKPPPLPTPEPAKPEPVTVPAAVAPPPPPPGYVPQSPPGNVFVDPISLALRQRANLAAWLAVCAIPVFVLAFMATYREVTLSLAWAVLGVTVFLSYPLHKVIQSTLNTVLGLVLWAKIVCVFGLVTLLIVTTGPLWDWVVVTSVTVLLIHMLALDLKAAAIQTSVIEVE